MTGASQLVGELLSAAIGNPHSAVAAWPQRHDTGVDFESLERRLSTGFDVLAGFRYPPVLADDDVDSLVRCAAHLLRGGRVADLESLGGSGAARVFAFWDES